MAIRKKIGKAIKSAKAKKKKVGRGKPARATTVSYRGKSRPARGRAKLRKRKAGTRSRR